MSGYQTSSSYHRPSAVTGTIRNTRQPDLILISIISIVSNISTISTGVTPPGCGGGCLGPGRGQLPAGEGGGRGQRERQVLQRARVRAGLRHRQHQGEYSVDISTAQCVDISRYYCHYNMLQVCTKIHRPVCSPVTKQHCTTAPQEPVCETVYEEVCSSVPEQSCDTGNICSK